VTKTFTFYRIVRRHVEEQAEVEANSFLEAQKIVDDGKADYEEVDEKFMEIMEEWAVGQDEEV
jgi:predicted metal-dependent hydrolase